MSGPVEDSAATRSAVRRNAIWATGAAVLMLYYGLGKEAPESFPPHSYGWTLLLCALQIGGGAMALSAVLSLIGVPLALLYDAVVSEFIGAALVVSGVLIYADRSHQAIFNILFGVIFIHSGYRNWREFTYLASVDFWITTADDDEGTEGAPATPARPVGGEAPAARPPDTLRNTQRKPG